MTLRLGLGRIKGLNEDDARRLATARGNGFADLADLARRARVRAGTIEKLAAAGALASLGLDRRGALWAAKGLDLDPLPLFAEAAAREEKVVLAPLAESAEVVEDYATLGLSLRRHPLGFLREDLAGEGVVPCQALARLEPGRRVTVAGLVTVRQRPSTARGIIFATIEDETDIANLVIFPDVFERFRQATLGAVLLKARGRLEREGLVIHVLVERLDDLTDRLRALRPAVVAQTPLLVAARAPPAIGPLSRDFQ